MSSVDELEAEIKHLRNQIKGYKGMATRQVLASSWDPLPSTSPSTSQEPPHVAPAWMKDCPTCNAPNPNFTGPPNVFCNSDSCQGRIPLGRVTQDQIERLDDGRVDFKGVHACTNCGSNEDAKLVGDVD